MKQKLSTQLSVGFACIVLTAVALVSLASNLLIQRQFEKYVEAQQKDFADRLAGNLSIQYDRDSGQWNLDYLHGFGMYALDDGYIIKVYDAEKNMVWDAENHDMTLCHQVMREISFRMESQKPGMAGDFVTHWYELYQKAALVGYADISYYSPYSYKESDFHFLTMLNHILPVVGMISLAGAAAAGAVLARRIARPIVKVTEVTREIAQGNYKIRFETESSTKELNELTKAVNRMAGALKEQEEMRRRMTADVAHELRTPLANVSSQLEAILEGVLEPSRERLERCFNELGRLSGIVSDLECLRQIESDQMILNREPVALLELAGSVRAAFETELAAKKLDCIVTGESAVVNGDRNRLHQVVYNLVSNAVKYTPEGGKIEIAVKRLPEEGVISVKDTGIGIPQKELLLIFERFYRTDRSRSRKSGGAGIGLTIAKAIVEAHGGRILAESRDGEGSTFTVSLPFDSL